MPLFNLHVTISLLDGRANHTVANFIVEASVLKFAGLLVGGKRNGGCREDCLQVVTHLKTTIIH